MPSVTIRVDFEPVPDADGRLPSMLDAADVVIWHVAPNATCEDPSAIEITAAHLVGTACPVCSANVPRENTVCHACGHTIGVLV